MMIVFDWIWSPKLVAKPNWWDDLGPLRSGILPREHSENDVDIHGQQVDESHDGHLLTTSVYALPLNESADQEVRRDNGTHDLKPRPGVANLEWVIQLQEELWGILAEQENDLGPYQEPVGRVHATAVTAFLVLDLELADDVEHDHDDHLALVPEALDIDLVDEDDSHDERQ